MLLLIYWLEKRFDASKSRNIATIILLTFFPAICQSYVPNIDCSTTENYVERTICDSENVSRLDSQLQEAYSIASKQNKSTDSLERNQDSWISQIRNQCKDEACLITVYSQRIEELKSKVTSHTEPATVVNAQSAANPSEIAVPSANTAAAINPKALPDVQANHVVPEVVAHASPETLPTQNSGSPAKPDSGVGTVILFIWLGLTAIGVVTGWSGSVTVFRNYDDLALVFFSGAGSLAALMLMGFSSRQNNETWIIILFFLVLLFVIGLLGLIVVRTWFTILR